MSDGPRSYDSRQEIGGNYQGRLHYHAASYVET